MSGQVDKSRKRSWIPVVAVILIATGGITGALVFVGASDPSQQSAFDSAKVLRQAEELANQGKHRQVISLLDQHLPELNNNADALALLAESSIHVIRPDNQHIVNAVRLYRRAHELNPNLTNPTIELFYIHFRLNEIEPAIEFGQTARQQDPQNVQLRVDLANTLFANNDHAEAITVADEAIELQPENLFAYEIRIKAMVADNASDDQILKFVEEASIEHVNSIDKEDLLFCVLKANGISSEETRSFAKNASETQMHSSRARWLASQLEEFGDLDAAMDVLSKSIRNEKSDDLDLATAYRYFQAGRYSEILELTENYSSDDRADEVLIVRALASWITEQTDELAKAADKLGNIDTRLTRAWSPVIQKLERPGNERELLEAVIDARKSFPVCPYLSFIEGITWQSLGDLDMAVARLQRSTDTAPRWAMPRVVIADLHARRGNYLTALVHGATALRINPLFEPGYDIVLHTVTTCLANNIDIPDDVSKVISNGLQAFATATEDPNQQTILNALIARLEDHAAKADEILGELVSSSPTLSSREWELVSVIAVGDSLTETISEKMLEYCGPKFGSLRDSANEIYRSNGPAAVEEWLTQQTIHDEPIPELTQRMVLAELLTMNNSDEATEYWLKLAEDNQDNVRLLEHVFHKDSLASEFETRKQILQWIKHAGSEDGATYRLSSMSLRMDQHPTQATAAEIVLEMTEMLEDVSNSPRAWLTLAEAYAHLDQVDKAMATLEKAIENGVDPPAFYVHLAEHYSTSDPDKALGFAQKCLGYDLPAEQTLVVGQVLIDVKSFKAAAAILRPLIANKEITDTDEDFDLVRAHAIASALSQDPESADMGLAELAEQTDRWFDLWVEVGKINSLPIDTARDWLEESEPWANNDSRRRKLTAAWIAVASQSRDSDSWQHALQTIETISKPDRTEQDQMIAAKLYEKIGEAESALDIYEEIGRDGEDNHFRAISFNRIARIHLEQDIDLKQATDAVQQAMNIVEQPELFNTMASIYVRMGKRSEAMDTLNTGLDRFPNDVRNAIFLCELLLDDEQPVRVESLLTKIRRKAESDPNLPIEYHERLDQVQNRLLRMLNPGIDSNQ